MNEDETVIGLVIIAILIIINAIVSAVEGAIDTVNESKVRKKSEEGDIKSTKLLKIIEGQGHYLSIIELILALVNGLIGFVYAVSIYEQIRKYVMVNEMIVVIVVSLVLLYIVVLFGNLLPKKFAVKFSEETAYRTIGFIMLVINITKPFIFLLDCSTNLILKLFKINPKELEESVTEEEIISMVNEGHEQGVLEASEASMIANIIEFDEKEVKDIMTHRKNMISMPSSMSVEKALSFMLENNYSRYPLYEENIDNIVGILHLKDMTKYYVTNKGKGLNKTIKQIARKPYFIPDTQSINVLFNNMQLKKMHMAIAIDEYGQTAGVIAMEDILEEIVGNILDEYDVDEKSIIKQGDNQYLMKGMTALEDIEELLDIEIDEDEYDTLNGLLVSIMDRIPADNERVSLSYKGYEFKIMDVKNKMIRFVKVTKKNP